MFSFLPPLPVLHAHPRCCSVHMHTHEPHPPWPKSVEPFFIGFCCCSMCLFAFLAGDHWPKLYMHPKFPMENISTRKVEGNRIAQGHTVAFPWGTNWFAPKWLQPVSLRFRRLQRVSANVVERHCWQRAPVSRGLGQFSTVKALLTG